MFKLFEYNLYLLIAKYIVRIRAESAKNHHHDYCQQVRLFMQSSQHFVIASLFSHSTSPAIQYITPSIIHNLRLSQESGMNPAETIEHEAIFDVEQISNDQDLLHLFSQLEQRERNLRGLSNRTHSFEHPAKYNEKDLEKDYQSQYFEDQESIKKTKKHRKSKMIVNKVQQNNRRNKSKLYIEMLESRVYELQKEIQGLRKTNRLNKDYIRKLDESGHIINGFFINRQRHYQKLTEYIKNDSINEENFKEEFSMLRMRQGALGKDRVKAVNYYFKELVQIILPDLQKYVMKTVQEQADLFDPHFIKYGTLGSSAEQWRREMIMGMNLSHQKVAKISSLRCEIIEERQKFALNLDSFYELKCRLMGSARSMETIYDRLHSILTPRQIATCLCLLEKYKFEKGFSMDKLMSPTFAKLQEQETQTYNPLNLYGLNAE